MPAPAGDAEDGSETAAAPADDGSEAKRKKDGKKEKGKKDKKKKGKAEKKKGKEEKGKEEGQGRQEEEKQTKIGAANAVACDAARPERRTVYRYSSFRANPFDPFSGTPLGREPRMHAD